MKPYLDELLSKIKSWARDEKRISSLAIVGSYATGKQTEVSDIDLVIVSKAKENLLRNRKWTRKFGDQTKEKIEDWGMITSVRVWYAKYGEVEFGLAPLEWLKIPSDEGTSKVVNNGMSIVYDPNGELERLREHCYKTTPKQSQRKTEKELDEPRL